MASSSEQTLHEDVDISAIQELVSKVPNSPDTYEILAEKNKLAVSC